MQDGVFFCKRVVQGLVVLIERCQKLRKRDSFKRVVQECFLFAREMSKAAQGKFFQESCARVFFCQRDVQSCTRFIVVLIVVQKRDSHIFVSFENY